MKRSKRNKSKKRSVKKSVLTVNQSPKPPFFTVATFTYNRCEWLAGALRSVLVQTYADFELLVVDDGSTDQTGQVVMGLNDHRIRYVKLETNQGRPAARNRAVKEARGEYIVWMGDDDLMRPDLLARYFETIRHSERIDVLYSNLSFFVDEPGDLNQLFEPIDWRVHRGELVSAKLSGSVIPDPGTATRLAFLRGFDGPYDEEFFRAQDYELWTRMALDMSIHKLDETLYDYRQHSRSASGGYFTDFTLESKIIRRHVQHVSHQELAPSFDWDEPEISRAKLMLRVAQSLNEYRDGYNAMRFIQAVPGWSSDLDFVEQAVLAYVIQGHLSQATALLQDVQWLFEHGERWGALNEKVTRLQTAPLWFCSSTADLADKATMDEMLKSWGWTYDLARTYALQHANSGDVHTAAEAYCLASRLSPTEQECYNRSLELRAAVVSDFARGKLDSEKMRSRLLEVYNPELDADATDHSERKQVHFITLTEEASSSFRKSESAFRHPNDEWHDWSEADPLVTSDVAFSFANQLCDAIENMSGHWVVFIDTIFEVMPQWWRNLDMLSDEAHVHVFRSHLRKDTHIESVPLDVQLSEDDGLAALGMSLHGFVISRARLLDWLREPEESEFMSRESAALNLPVLCLRDESKKWHPFASFVDNGRSKPFSTTELMKFFQRHQNAVRFNRALRQRQNECLAEAQLSIGEFGQISIVCLGMPDVSASAVWADDLRRLSGLTYAPHKYTILINQPNEDQRSLLGQLRTEGLAIKAILNDRVATVPKLINQAISTSTGDVLVILSPSVRFTPFWLSKVLWRFQQTPKLGMVFADDAHEGNPGCTAFIIRTELLESIGGFDLNLEAEASANDFATRIHAAGFDIMKGTDFFSVSPSLVADGGLTKLHFEERPASEAVPEIRHCAYAPLLGDSPSTRPVTIVNERERSALIYPNWNHLESLMPVLEAVHHDDRWTLYFRCELSETKQLCDRLGNWLRNHPWENLEIQLANTPLADDREGGLLVAVDAIIVDEQHPKADLLCRRAVDCGCRTLTPASFRNSITGS